MSITETIRLMEIAARCAAQQPFSRPEDTELCRQAILAAFISAVSEGWWLTSPAKEGTLPAPKDPPP